MTRKHETMRVRIGWIVALALLAVVSVAGSASVTAAPDEVLGNRGVAQRFFDEVLNEGNAATAESMVSTNAVLHVPGGEYRGAAGCADLVSSVREAYPGATFQVRNMIVDGDTVVVSWTLADISGNGDAVPTIAANGASVDGIALLHIENYLIAEVWMR